MRAIITLIAVVAFATACDPVQEAGLSAVVDDVTEEPVSYEPVDTRIPGGWLLYGAEAEGFCNGMIGSISIPCRDILNVCIDSGDGQRSTKWMPEVFRCTDESPTWRDVCLTVDPLQWPFYGYTPDECLEVLAR